MQYVFVLYLNNQTGDIEKNYVDEKIFSNVRVLTDKKQLKLHLENCSHLDTATLYS